MDAASDIGYFIITKPGRLWLVRGLLAIFKRVFLLNSHRNFCTNYFVDTNSLEIEEKNFYTAIEASTLIITYGRSVCKNFVDKNRWTSQFLPNFVESRQQVVRELNSTIKKILELIFIGLIGEWLDKVMMRMAMRRWRKKFRESFNAEDFAIAFKSRRNVSKNHPLFFQKRVLDIYAQRIESFELENKLKLTA
jgi:hypothetical protein